MPAHKSCDFHLFTRVFFNIKNDTKHTCDCSVLSLHSYFTWNPSLILATLSTRVFPTSNAKWCQKKEPVELQLPANVVALNSLKQETAVASRLIWVPEIGTQGSVSTFRCLVALSTAPPVHARATAGTYGKSNFCKFGEKQVQTCVPACAFSP